MSSKRMRHAKRLHAAYGKKWWDEGQREAFEEVFVPTFVWPVTIVEVAEPEPPTTALRMFVRETVDEFEGTESKKGVSFVRKVKGSVAMVRKGRCPHRYGSNPLTGEIGPTDRREHTNDTCPALKGALIRFEVKDYIIAVPDGRGGFVDPTDGTPIAEMTL